MSVLNFDLLDFVTFYYRGQVNWRKGLMPLSCSVLVTQTGSNVLMSEYVIGGLINFLQAVLIYIYMQSAEVNYAAQYLRVKQK